MSAFSGLSKDEKAELWACLALRHAEGIGARRAARLARKYGGALEAVRAGLARAWQPGEAHPKAAEAFAAESWRQRAAGEWRAVQKSGVRLVLWTGGNYPALLRELDDPPLVLYYSGDISLLRGPAVGVVGARSCSREGLAAAAFFSRALSRAGVTVISGMAEGIDRAAHLAGLEGPGGSVAVLGTGIDVVYPQTNADLALALESNGLLLSEFAPGSPAEARHFPIRNRLISGLSRGVLVVEAAGRSGSLITARLALEQGRDVFAVPGHLTAEVSAGCRELIRRGAKPVFSADDVLAELAPLLTLEARRALALRREEERAAGTPAPRRPGLPDLNSAAVASAESVLPEGSLPWRAPPGKKRQKAKAPPPSAPPSKAERAGRDGAGGPEPASPPASAKPGRVRGAKPAALSLKAGAIPPLPARPFAGRLAPESPAPAAPEVSSAPLKNGPASLRADQAENGRAQSLTEDERTVLLSLGTEARHIDELSRRLDMDAGRLSGLLLVLEVRGLARRLPGMLYLLT